VLIHKNYPYDTFSWIKTHNTSIIFNSFQYSMDLRRLPITKPSPIFYPVTRPLTCVTSPGHHHQDQPPQPQPTPLPPPPPPPLQHHSHRQPSNQSLPNWVSSILSNPSLDSSKCKALMPHLSPSDFDLIFFSVKSNVNPKTALNFFYFASEAFKFRFTVRSY
jgi:hypothetical protein